MIVAGSSKPTTYDVAKRANVSQMTVSRVLRKSGNVSKSVTEKVLQAAEDIGYVRNNLAGSFAGQSTNLIGVIIPSLTNSVFTDVLSGFDDAIRDSSLQMAISVTNYDQTQEFNLVKDMLAWRPAGIVLTGLEHEERTRVLLKQNNINTIEMIDVDGQPISKCVGHSHCAAAEAVATHLIEKGYTRFGYVGSALQADERAAKRKNAFEQILNDNGLYVERTALSPESSSMLLGQKLTAELLQDNSQPIAIYFSNDDLAAGGLLYCVSQGLAIPDDVAIASFNGLEILDALPMRVTTYKTPRYDIGKIVGQYMLGQMTDKITQLSGELIIGNTT